MSVGARPPGSKTIPVASIKPTLPGYSETLPRRARASGACRSQDNTPPSRLPTWHHKPEVQKLKARLGHLLPNAFEPLRKLGVVVQVFQCSVVVVVMVVVMGVLWVGECREVGAFSVVVFLSQREVVRQRPGKKREGGCDTRSGVTHALGRYAGRGGARRRERGEEKGCLRVSAAQSRQHIRVEVDRPVKQVVVMVRLDLALSVAGEDLEHDHTLRVVDGVR